MCLIDTVHPSRLIHQALCIQSKLSSTDKCSIRQFYPWPTTDLCHILSWSLCNISSCNFPFKTSSVKAKIVPTFCIDGQVKKLTIYSYRCTNKKLACNLDAYPHFYACNQRLSMHDDRYVSYRVTYRSLFEHSKFVYSGGDYSFEKTVLGNMSNIL
jgi:hypothetical protein